jgi:predicted glycosyltransferase
LIIPSEAVDGLNLVWHSDFVISGGGTMNREAAALGVPVYSIFRGHPGAVDLYLASKQRMTLLKSVDDVRHKIAVAKRERNLQPNLSSRHTLQALVGLIMGVALETQAVEH